MISFDVSSLYTNVPVMEAIETCAELLYSGKYKLPPVDKETFIELSQMSSCDVLEFLCYITFVQGSSTHIGIRLIML